MLPLKCVAPRDRSGHRFVTRGLNADAQPGRTEIRRQHDGAVQLLKIHEVKRQAVLLRGIAERRPVQLYHLVAAQAFHADQRIAGDRIVAAGALGQAKGEVPTARTRYGLQFLLQLQALMLGIATDDLEE